MHWNCIEDSACNSAGVKIIVRWSLIFDFISIFIITRRLTPNNNLGLDCSFFSPQESILGTRIYRTPKISFNAWSFDAPRIVRRRSATISNCPRAHFVCQEDIRLATQYSLFNNRSPAFRLVSFLFPCVSRLYFNVFKVPSRRYNPKSS